MRSLGSGKGRQLRHSCRGGKGEKPGGGGKGHRGARKRPCLDVGELLGWRKKRKGDEEEGRYEGEWKRLEGSKKKNEGKWNLFSLSLRRGMLF